MARHVCAHCRQEYNTGFFWSSDQYCSSGCLVAAQQRAATPTPEVGLQETPVVLERPAPFIPASAAGHRAADYDYLTVQVPPTIVVRSKDLVGNEAAQFLQTLIDSHAASGWDFYRVDTLGVLEQPGCLAAIFGAREVLRHYFVVTFRRARVHLPEQN